MFASRGEEGQPKADNHGLGGGGQPNVDARIDKNNIFILFCYYLVMLSAQDKFDI